MLALLYTGGADPQALTFYRMMLGAEMGRRIGSIELFDLTPEDRARADSTQSPTGRPMKLALPATKQLVMRRTPRLLVSDPNRSREASCVLN